MKKTLSGKNVSPKCIYCETGIVTNDGKTILCKRKGVMQPDSFCRKFRYDPLKRVPDTVKLQTDFSEEDFAL
ncbi:MAG: hypothetical protein IKM66_02285 [Clostridia bacterium]|nr:hypothetical protein [Clostridia bacterium]